MTMLGTLPPPEVLRCYFDDGFAPRLPAMCLRWDAELAGGERSWELPEGVTLVGPPPERFGVSIRRRGEDSYSVRLLWDRSCLTWEDLTRTQLLTCSLEPLLGAMGTDLWYLLDQPVRSGPGPRDRAA
jgi:hypothetical protein